MNAQEWLDRTQAITDQATAGPWEQDVDDGVMGLGVYTDTHSDGHQDRWDRQDAAIRTEAADDAEFIAHARTALPQAIAALRAVMRVHRMTDDFYEPYKFCVACSSRDRTVAWPCPTITTIQGTLGDHQ